MPVCINQSGTWRNATTLCVNDSGTWRNTIIGQINQSGVWRTYLDKRCPGCCPFTTSCALGSNIEGGFLICKSSNVAWIVAPSSSERSGTAPGGSHPAAQQVSGCTGWFIPTVSQLQNPGYACRQYWDSYSVARYWSSTAQNAFQICWVNFNDGGPSASAYTAVRCIRSFRCVTY